MSDFNVLIVELEDRDAALVGAAISRVALVRQHRLKNGDDAVFWVRSNECHARVISYDLPGLSGVETLMRMRSHRPSLPVIMVSNARSEKAAVESFRAGVVDYIPKHAGYSETVGNLVKQLKDNHASDDVTHAVLIADDVPPVLLTPTYQNRLRLIGRHLDQYAFRGINILEVGGGFLVRGIPSGGRTPEAMEFRNQDFPSLMVSAIRTSSGAELDKTAMRLLPTGYEDFLRALGYWLDQSDAEAITVSELGDLIVVGGVVRAFGYDTNMIHGPMQRLMRQPDIELLLEEAFRRRESASSRQRGPVARLLQRGSSNA